MYIIIIKANLLIDQPKIKKTFAIKNPVFLKRNTISLDRDSTNRNIHYIQFNYDALLDFELNIYFNAKKNLDDKAINSYISGNNFHPMNISCLKGHNIRFTDRSIFIDIDHFNSNKENIDDCIDIVIELISVPPRGDRIISITTCKLIEEKNGNIVLYRIKPESQRLKTMNMWLEVHDVFNSALDSGECLICCSNIRNTLFLPCKHSCCCSSCSHSLRIRNNPCPICKNSK